MGAYRICRIGKPEVKQEREINMIRSMFSGVSGLRAHQAKMDTIGNNVANVNTFGYKASRATFQDSIYQTMSAASDGGTTFGGKNASQVGYGSKIASIDLMFSQGSYAPTDSPTDCMIDGGGFFIVGDKNQTGLAPDAANGSIGTDIMGGLSFSRLGDFKFDGDGFLVDSNANIVYGYLGGAGNAIDTAELKPIRIRNINGVGQEPTDTEKRANINSIRIDATGTIIGIEEKAGVSSSVTIGQIALANMTNPNGLEKSKGPYYKAVSNIGTMVVGAPGDRGTGQIISNGLEMANVDLAKEFSEMITTQRGFQANTRIITVSDEMLQELLSMKR